MIWLLLPMCALLAFAATALYWDHSALAAISLIAAIIVSPEIKMERK